MENDIIQLRRQMDEVQVILLLLAQKFNGLQQQINLLVANERAAVNPENPETAAAEEAKNINPSFVSVVDIVKKLLYSIVTNVDGVKNLQYGIEISDDGVNKLISSIMANMDGVNKVQNAIAANEDGVNKARDGIATGDDGVNKIQQPKAAKEEATESERIWLAKRNLKVYMLRSSRDTIENTAKILNQLHTQKRNSYKDLRRLTGLSEDGLTKRIMAMKKAGFIVRTAFQQYQLTEKARKVLEL